MNVVNLVFGHLISKIRVEAHVFARGINQSECKFSPIKRIGKIICELALVGGVFDRKLYFDLNIAKMHPSLVDPSRFVRVILLSISNLLNGTDDGKMSKAEEVS